MYIDGGGEKAGPAGNNMDGSTSYPKLSGHIKQHYSTRYGVEIGEVNILVHALPMSGRKYVMGAGKGRITLEKQWHNISQPFALQAIVKDILVEDPGLKTYCTVEELFPVGTDAFMLGQPHYGAQGKVIKIDPEHQGRIQLKFTVNPEPDLSGIISRQRSESYMPGYRAAQRCGVSGHIVARITGTIFVVRGAREQQSDSASKSNIGLGLKFSKRQEEVCGYTKRTEDGQWMYSMATVQTILQYQQTFPEVFEFLASGQSASMDMFHELDLFPGTDGLERMSELAKWLESLPTNSALRQPYGTQTLEESIIKELEEVTVTTIAGGSAKEVVMQVKPHLIYLPNHLAGCALVEPGTVFCLYDRVVNVREGFSVPLGLRGTVIRIQKGARVEDNVYDVLFDEIFTGGLTLRCSQGRGYRMPGSAMINLTFKEYGGKPRRGEPEKTKPRAVVRPFDKNSGGEYQGQRRENVWENRNKNTPTGKAKPQPREEEQRSEPSSGGNKVKKGFPPPPQLLPKPGDTLLSQTNKPGDKKESQIKILTKQNSEEGNFQDIWKSLSGQSGSSAPEANKTKEGDKSANKQVINNAPAVTDVENSLKCLLNISGKNNPAEEQPKFVIGGATFDTTTTAGNNPMQELISGQSYCRILMTQLTSGGQAMPRYDYITNPDTGLVAAQVSLEDGYMHHSPHPCGDRDAAAETAARAALESLGIIPGSVNVPVSRRGGRGHRGHRDNVHANRHQPWVAEYSGQYPAPREHRTDNNLGLAGTEQMDIRYRDKKPDPRIPQDQIQDDRKQHQQNKPAFVPLQVSRQAVKQPSKERSKERDDAPQLPDLERVEATVVKKDVSASPRSSVSRENTPQRPGGRGRGQPKGGKKRMAANFD